MLLDGLGWSHYSVFAPCIMTQTRVLGRSGGGQHCSLCSLASVAASAFASAFASARLLVPRFRFRWLARSSLRL